MRGIYIMGIDDMRGVYMYVCVGGYVGVGSSMLEWVV